MVARQQAAYGGKTSCGLKTDWFINSRLSGSRIKVTVTKNLIYKHQSGFDWVTDGVLPNSTAETSQTKMKKGVIFLLFKVPAGFIITHLISKKIKALASAIPTSWPHESLDRACATAAYIIIAKGHFQLKLISKHKDIEIKMMNT